VDQDLSKASKVQRQIRRNRQNQLVLLQTDAPYAAYEVAGNLASAKPQGRLTLESGVAVPLTDQLSKTDIFFTPFEGANVPIFDGALIGSYVYAELTLGIDATNHLASKLYDLFVVLLDGSPVLGSGPAWTNVTTRSAALVLLNGIYVNAAAMNLYDSTSGTTSISALQATYVGTFCSLSAGNAFDATYARLLYNAYNRIYRTLNHYTEVTNSWNYSTQTWRIVNADNGNNIQVLQGLQIEPIDLRAIHAVKNSTSTSRSASTGIGVDSTTVNSATVNAPADCTDAARALLSAEFNAYVGLGYHVLNWLEIGAGTDTQTWYGDGGIGSDRLQTGMQGYSWQ
jgi:hypothetical protein